MRWFGSWQVLGVVGIALAIAVFASFAAAAPRLPDDVLEDSSVLLRYPPATATPARPSAPSVPVGLASVGYQVVSPAQVHADWQALTVPAALAGDEARWRLTPEGSLQQIGVGPTAASRPVRAMLISPTPATGITASFFDSGNGTIGLVANASDAGHYVARLHLAPVYDGTAVIIERVSPTGEATTLATLDGPPRVWAWQWHTLGLQVDGDLITLALDGEPLVLTMDPAPLPPGSVGLMTYAVGHLVIDAIQVEE